MIDGVWLLYVAPIIFGLLIGFVALLVFVHSFSLSGYKKVLPLFTWFLGHGVIIGAIKYLESTISKQAGLSQNPDVIYAHFRIFLVSYLGGYGIGGLLAVAFRLRQMAVDQAFIDIFLPLRRELSDQEVIALKLFLVPRTPSLLKRLWSYITHRPLNNPSAGMTPDQAAIFMRVSRQDYDNYLTDGMRKLRRYMRQGP